MNEFATLPELLAAMHAQGLTDLNLVGFDRLPMTAPVRAHELRHGGRELGIMTGEGWIHLGFARAPR